MNTAAAIDWKQRAAECKPDGRALIGGQRVATVSGETFDNLSPIDGRSLGQRGARPRRRHRRRRRVGARAPSTTAAGPRKSPARARSVLQRFADAILAAKDELALLETLDMGKPIQYSAGGRRALARRARIAWYAEAVDKIYDEIAPTPRNALALITREPMGVIGAIVPWNYPMIMAAWKLGPALAAGNSVVLKPSEKSAAHRAAAGRARARGRPARRRVQRRAGLRRTKPARRWRCTWTSTRSASPAPRASAAGCSSTPAAAT